MAGRLVYSAKVGAFERRLRRLTREILINLFRSRDKADIALLTKNKKQDTQNRLYSDGEPGANALWTYSNPKRCIRVSVLTETLR
jgi:hypothetical protein